jgi:hypothetical protein
MLIYICCNGRVVLPAGAQPTQPNNDNSSKHLDQLDYLFSKNAHSFQKSLSLLLAVRYKANSKPNELAELRPNHFILVLEIAELEMIIGGACF